MVASDEMDLLRIYAFECQQKANSLDGVISSINKVAEENIIEIFNIFLLAIFMRSAVESEETHQICELTMNVSEYFQRWLRLKNHWLTDNDLLSNIAKSYNFL